MMLFDIVEPSDIWLALDLLGYDGIIYKNFGETSTGEDSYLVWNSQNIYVKQVDDIPYSDIYSLITMAIHEKACLSKRSRRCLPVLS